MQLFVLPSTTNGAATNMAIDAALLASIPEESAIFRHYGWAEPTITFGYTQLINEVRSIVPDNIHLCRRITGGGIVDHLHDWTYSLILHSQIKAVRIPATELYLAIHKCIQQVLKAQSVKTQLAPCHRICKQEPGKKITAPNQCFVHPTANDVLHPDGTKIAGAAIKRTRQGLLVQGSIDRNSLPEAFNFQMLSNTLSKALADMLQLSFSKDCAHFLNEPKIQQERKRFENVAWIHKR